MLPTAAARGTAAAGTTTAGRAVMRLSGRAELSLNKRHLLFLRAPTRLHEFQVVCEFPEWCIDNNFSILSFVESNSCSIFSDPK
jgi:hypothetical protein